MPAGDPFDFWYAVSNTEILMLPPRRLETFGSTVLDYHLVSELMDEVNGVRVREGRIQAFRPEILTPAAYMESILEGFHEEAAGRYAEWLRENAKELLILRYGFRIRKEEVREQIVHDALEAVVDRVRADLKARANPLGALVRGVDEPWEVCLVKLMVEMVQRSGPEHARVLREDPSGDRHEVEAAFRAASKDRSKIAPLADLLRARGLFKDYEDRFFALVQSHKRGG
ncbi:MAG: hypothetical protein FJ221_04620 [Lentisphaerae bacterium]|nr:hypothetical protein [Lentisphaerota bacterium]